MNSDLNRLTNIFYFKTITFMREVDLIFTCERDIFNILHIGGGEIFLPD